MPLFFGRPMDPHTRRPIPESEISLDSPPVKMPPGTVPPKREKGDVLMPAGAKPPVRDSQTEKQVQKTMTTDEKPDVNVGQVADSDKTPVMAPEREVGPISDGDATPVMAPEREIKPTNYEEFFGEIDTVEPAEETYPFDRDVEAFLQVRDSGINIEESLFPAFLAYLSGTTTVENGRGGTEIVMKNRHVQMIASRLRSLRKRRENSPQNEQRQIDMRIAEAEAELLPFLYELGESLREEQRFRFLNRPLAEIHKSLKQGRRHPKHDYFYEHNRKLSAETGAVYAESVEKMLARMMKPQIAEMYLDLMSGLESLPVEPAEGQKSEIRRAGRQIENGFLTEAAETLDKLSASAESPELKSKLADYRDLAREYHIDYAVETEKASDVLYEWLLNNPEMMTAYHQARFRREHGREASLKELAELAEKREDRLKTRRQKEMSLRHGKVLSWTPVGKKVKKISGSEADAAGQTRLDESNINGNDKVFLVEIHMVDENKNPIYETNEKGEVAPKTIKAYAKSAHSDSWFRHEIPPDATDVNEWLAGYEATAFGADEFFPATAMRGFDLIGKMSLQEQVEGKDERGRPIPAIPTSDLRKIDHATGKNIDLDFDNKIPGWNKELIAILQLYQLAADAGLPNIILTKTLPNNYFAHSIDNGLTNPRSLIEAQYNSAMCLERGAKRDSEPISEETLALIELYAGQLDEFLEVLERFLPYDTKMIAEHRRATVRTLLESKRFPRYNGGIQMRDTYRTRKTGVDPADVISTTTTDGRVVDKATRSQHNKFDSRFVEKYAAANAA